jgi:hypothetical protein
MNTRLVTLGLALRLASGVAALDPTGTGTEGQPVSVKVPPPH